MTVARPALLGILVALAIGCTSKSSTQDRDASGDGSAGTGGAGFDAGSSDGSADTAGCGPGFPVGASRPAGDGCNVCNCIGPGSWVCSTAACPIGGSGGGGAGGAGGSAGAGGSLGGRGGGGGAGGASGGSGARGGTGGGGGAMAGACSANGPCALAQAPCSTCDRGGTLQRFCQCAMNGTGQGYWNCGGSAACGSNNCGLEGSTCDPRTQTTCEQCDPNGAHRSCTCTPRASQGEWACSSSAGACGVACGNRKCLAGEICVQLGRYPGTLPPDGGTGVTLTPTCAIVPDACGANPPSCAACIVSAYGCSPPGTCRDLGPQTFECILGGA